MKSRKLCQQLPQSQSIRKLHLRTIKHWVEILMLPLSPTQLWIPTKSLVMSQKNCSQNTFSFLSWFCCVGLKFAFYFTVSKLHGEVKPAESREPPVKPQTIERADPVQLYTDAKLYKKLFNKMKGTMTHLLYLGQFQVTKKWNNFISSFLSFFAWSMNCWNWCFFLQNNKICVREIKIKSV